MDLIADHNALALCIGMRAVNDEMENNPGIYATTYLCTRTYYILGFILACFGKETKQYHGEHI